MTELVAAIDHALLTASALTGSRELSIVKTKLEEAQLWATKLPENTSERLREFGG